MAKAKHAAGDLPGDDRPGGAVSEDPFVESRSPGRRHSDIDWRLALTAYLILLAIAFVAGSKLGGRVDKNTRQIAVLARELAEADQTQINGSCHRLNIIRAEENRNQLADYRFDIVEINLVHASLKHRTASVPRTRQQQQQTVRFISALQVTANAKEWIGLTDCISARRTGYRVPQPTPFNVRLPPRSALQLSRRN